MKLLLSICLFVVGLGVATSALAQGVLDIAHRGYAAKNPESTLAAFQWAIESGADGLELDVRQSADNVLLVTHEPVIAEIGNQRVESTASTQAFLKSDIPSLEEVIILAKRYQTPLWIEIKQSHLYPGITSRLIALLKQYHYLNHVVIQSFNHQDLLEIYQENPDIPLLALFASKFEVSRLPSFVGYVGLPLSMRYYNAALLDAIHQRGQAVIFWRAGPEFETAEALRQFIMIGADGFMLDLPLKEILNSG